ncbi:uncharacterized protein [Coffea arabica]|uniref:Protein EMBRYONIC FLOWER 1-like n=1 Tax=Coffea arabica TaxID=13443 RepID=A0ABM4VKN2_COFAR
METNNNTVEENPPPKSSAPLIPISSICIELPPAPVVVRQPGNCHDNFCLREYVLEKRSTNPSGSGLFSPDDPIGSMEQLPPMEVPRFRFWRCTDCVSEFESTTAKVLQETQEGAATLNTEGIQAVNANVCLNANTVEGSLSLARMDEMGAVDDKNETNEPVEDAAETNINGVAVETREDTPSGHVNVPAQEVTADANISAPSELHESADQNARDTRNTAPADPESEQCRDHENATGMPRKKVRKVRLLTDLLGEKSSSRCGAREAVPLEPSRPENTGSEGQINPSKDIHSSVRSPLRKTKPVGEEDERNDPTNVAVNTKASRRDTGKAIMMVEARDSEEEVNACGGEGLFIGTKSERLRHRRSSTTPALGRQNSKQPQVLDCGTIPSLTRRVQAPSEAGNFGNLQSAEQREHGHIDLASGGLNPLLSLNNAAEGLDLSLDIFAKKAINQSSEGVRKAGMLFGKPLTPNQSDGYQRRSPQFDLNERASHKEMDFLQLGFNGKSSGVPGNLKESDHKADDIPMDIVELLAKQQYERRNGDAGASSGPSGAHVTSNTARGFLEVGEIRTVGQFVKEFPNFPSFRGVNSRSGISTASNYIGSAKGNSTNFSHMGRNNFKLFQGGENQLNSIFTAFAHNQHKQYGGVQVPATTSVRPDLPCSEPVDPLLLSGPTKLSFELGVQQKLPGEQHKGKTISDIKADELKRTEEARLMLSKPGDTIVSSKERGPLDAYANDSIPAMQLLSLMDGRPSGATFHLGSSKIVDKPFAPCSYHPRFSTNERQDFLNRSFLSSPSHPKETSGLRISYSDIYQRSRPLPAVLPGQISFKTPEQEKPREKSKKSGSGTGFGPSSSRGKDKQTATLHASDSIVHPQKHHRLEGPRRFNLEASGITGGVGRANGVSSEGECGWNRNPADFSLPVAGNEYTICARDLKFRKRNASREKRSSVKANGAKRQRKAKSGTEPQ